jgi:hypothetical protein
MNYNNGNIYYISDTKDEFMEKLASRKKQTKIVVYYNKYIQFSKEELDKFAEDSIIMIDELQKKFIVRSEIKRLSPLSVGDFVPGYVQTFSNPLIDSIQANIIVLGFEDGLIYYLFDNKEDLFKTLSTRKSRMKLNIYYKNIEFTKSEREFYWNANAWLTDKATKDKISSSWRETMKIVYM